MEIHCVSWVGKEHEQKQKWNSSQKDWAREDICLGWGGTVVAEGVGGGGQERSASREKEPLVYAA